MRKKVIAANWKMNTTINEGIKLASEIANKLKRKKSSVIVCPPFISLEALHSIIKDTAIQLGAQNLYFENNGAFTGEISAPMLRSVGCKFVIIGHSERRQIFNEDNITINKKIKKAIEFNLKPILCIGETLKERENGITNEIVKNQIEKGLEGISENQLKDVIIAYEPVWAIGTGKTATPEEANDVHKFIRNLISEKYSQNAAENLIIQYGGSVKPENAFELLSMENIDGALVGGASLNADSFIQIIEEADKI